jgi:uncharacterized protein (DUF433 family)
VRRAAVHTRPTGAGQTYLDLLAAGASRDEIMADYPYLEAEDITAALQFAA